MSEIRVENIIGETGTDAVKFTKGINVTGVTTATSFSGSGASLTGLTAGITMADAWRVSSNFTATAGNNIVTSNWERDDYNFDLIGTGLSHDGSGKFGFQETGKFLIMNRWSAYDSGERRYVGTIVQVSTDGISGTYNTVSESYDSLHDASSSVAFCAGGTDKILDVTNTNTYFYIKTSVVDSTTFDCNTTQQRFCFHIIRLGDT